MPSVGGEIGSRLCVCWVPSAPYDSHYSGKNSYLVHVLGEGRSAEGQVKTHDAKLATGSVTSTHLP